MKRCITSKILSGTKFGRLNFALLCCACLSLLPLSVVAQPIDFSGITIKEPVDIEFWKRHPQKGIEIDSSDRRYPRVIFHRPIDFQETNFKSTADFAGTRFNGPADFSNASFDSSVMFWGAEFHSTANFRSADFKGMAYFQFVTFDSSGTFFNASFHSMADFGGWGVSWTDFKGPANFQFVTFDSSVSFQYVGFHSTAHFQWANFKGRVNFQLQCFQDNVAFSSATLPDTLDFRYVREISREIDFTLCRPPRPKEKCHIVLVGANISKIKLNMALFELCFPVDTMLVLSSAGKVSIHDIDSSSYDGQLSVYESVLKKLKDDGFMDSYEILDIEYRHFKYKHGGFFDWHILDTVQQWWWNYGYSKVRVFLWAIGFWLLFSLLNLTFFYPKLSESVYAIDFLEKMQRSACAGIKKWIFYVLQVVSYTAIVFFGLKMDVAKFKEGVVRKHPGLFVYLMAVYVVGLVCLGFIVNIIFTR